MMMRSSDYRPGLAPSAVSVASRDGLTARTVSPSQEKTMRRFDRSLIGLALAATLALATSASAASEKPKESFGKGPAYKALGHFAVMHAGRMKPLDTLAREEIKQIYGRERIWLLDADDEYVASWEPVAAMLDWSARPDYWNDQPIIKVEYLPLKRFLLHGSSKALLSEIAAKDSTPAADKEAINKVASGPEIGIAEIEPLLHSTTLPKDDLLALARLRSKLGEGHKWLTPQELEDAVVTGADGQPTPFPAWIESIAERNREASMMPGGEAKLSEIEDKGYEAGTAFARYRSLRDRDMSRFLPILVMPRPFNQTYLTYTGEALKKAQETRGRGLSNFDTEAAVVLTKYLENVQSKDIALPGTDSTFDARYTNWLKEKSTWVPLVMLLDAKPEDLEKAGYPVAKVEAFRSAFRAMEAAEKASPGQLDEATANNLLVTARDLGTTINETYYPTTRELAREVSFNAFAPFFWAPFAYGLGTVLLALSLTVASYRSSVVSIIHKSLYILGISAFVGGIGLEIYGFSQRVLITGWAPVTGMYETVIWVGLVTAMLGLILEAVYRRTFAALAAAGVATFATALAATVPLLDPTIKSLTPVLRSNLWLTVHVLTIVSSYAAFALAMGLGMIATGYYLTATYRRSASILALISPIVVGLPLLAVGLVVREGSYRVIEIGQWAVDYGFWPSLIVLSIGILVSLMSVFAVGGELVNRWLARETLAASARSKPSGQRPADWADARELVAAGAGSPPPISGGSPEIIHDPRTLAMQETAAKIKPLSNFIYRSMQVGVLLVAAGTILGGVWADYSWGRFWGWDAKEVWALITLLVYLVPLHGRFAGWVNTFGLVMASVVCFLSVLMAWYGVNFLLGVGLHAYGFTKGGSQGTVGLFVICTLAIPAAAAWRRHLSQQQVVSAA
jgi:ABC-type transport system involved in cytochrome c biogenesis permease subunit